MKEGQGAARVNALSASAHKAWHVSYISTNMYLRFVCLFICVYMYLCERAREGERGGVGERLRVRVVFLSIIFYNAHGVQ